MADISPEVWAATLLRRLKIHQTPGAVQALTGWAKAEGGHWNNQAKYNPLNTTQPAKGAGNTGSQGNIKVYKDWNQGLQATVETLKNGRYGGILQALGSGDPDAVANAIGKTPWGTMGGLVQKTIASTPRVAGVHAMDIPGASPAPVTSNDTSSRSTQGIASGSTLATPAKPSVYDVIARYREATQAPEQASTLGAVYDPVVSGQQIQNTLESIKALQKPPVAAVSPVQAVGSGQAPPVVSSGSKVKGKVIVAPGANRAGVTLKKPLLDYLGQVAAVAGRPTTITRGTNHNRMTTSGNVSDHWDGYGADEAVGGDARQDNKAGSKGDLIAAHSIQVASGKSFEESLAMARKGGVWNFNTPMGRIQIIWRSLVGGNHYNHVHRGVKPA